MPDEIFRITLQEDVIFDKRRSRLYYDMLAMNFAAYDQNTGTFKSLGWFKYKDLERVFRNHTKDAVWFNRYNTAENKNYADAFLLRLFHGVIDKVENPDDDRIADTYAGRPYKEAVWAMEWEEMKMMETEVRKRESISSPFFVAMILFSGLWKDQPPPQALRGWRP
jgi:hypothetical protein